MAVSADSVLRLLDRRERPVFATFALARARGVDRRAARALRDRVRFSVSGLTLVRGWIDFGLLEHPGAAARRKKGRAPA